MKLGRTLLERYGLPKAKTQDSGKNITPDYVLCVYDSEPKLRLELRQYADEKSIRYRYWKSDEETLSGKYSPEFLRQLRGRDYQAMAEDREREREAVAWSEGLITDAIGPSRRPRRKEGLSSHA